MLTSSLLPYYGVLIAASVEGEIAYIAAATLVAQGHLNPAGVLVSGTVGAAIGDQAYFYLFRGRLPRWLARYPSLARKTAPLIDRVRRRASLMVLLIRFARFEIGEVWMPWTDDRRDKDAAALERKHQSLYNRLEKHLRIALAAACACVDVPAVKFSVLDLLSAFVWAAALLVIVGWFGPTYLAQYGLGGWKGALLVGLLVLALFKALGAYERRAMQRPD